MKKGFAFTFLVGLLGGVLAVLLFWYYQKSTTADEGALQLLDRLADLERRLKEWTAVGREQASQAVAAVTDEMPSFLQRPSTAVPEDLMLVKGIGPVFAQRLAEVGVDTLAKLTALTTEQLADMLEIPDGRAAAILAAAQSTTTT